VLQYNIVIYLFIFNITIDDNDTYISQDNIKCNTLKAIMRKDVIKYLTFINVKSKGKFKILI